MLRLTIGDRVTLYLAVPGRVYRANIGGSMSRSALLAQLRILGFDGVAASIEDGAPLADVLSDLTECERTHDDTPDAGVYAEARRTVRALYR